MKNSIWAILLFSLSLMTCGSNADNTSSHTTAQPSNIIYADHPSLLYAGRIDFSKPLAPKLSWPGSYIKANFTGTSLAMILDDQFGDNYFNVFIDDDWQNPHVIDCKKGEHNYQIANDLASGEHSLTIFKRTEGGEGNSQFIGLVIDNDALMASKPKRLERRIEFIGDSITSGMGNEAPLDGKDDNLAEKNNFLAYGAITARKLNAEYSSISQSGIGIMVSWFDFTMPDYFLQLNAHELNDSRWDFQQWQPHVVVINLFQNDSWLAEERLTPIPTKQQRIDAYEHFLARVRTAYPNALIIAALGSMSAIQPDSSWPEYISQAVKQRNINHADNNIYPFLFDYTGFEKHPRVSHHQQNSEKLTAFIKEKMSW